MNKMHLLSTIIITVFVSCRTQMQSDNHETTDHWTELVEHIQIFLKHDYGFVAEAGWEAYNFCSSRAFKP
jgi:hypothetical protein